MSPRPSLLQSPSQGAGPLLRGCTLVLCLGARVLTPARTPCQRLPVSIVTLSNPPATPLPCLGAAGPTPQMEGLAYRLEQWLSAGRAAGRAGGGPA